MTFADQVALHLRLDGVVVDQQTLGEGYDRLCPSAPLACKWRAWDSWGRVRVDDLARLAESACTQGDRSACEVLGLALIERDPVAASDRLRPACDAGSPRACTELGRIVAAGLAHVLPDAAAALALHERACGLGHGAGCARAGKAPPVEPATGCAAGLLASCDTWLATATGADRVTALERLCVADRARCAELAAALAATDPGVLRTDRPVARATWTEGGVLLGWDAPTFLGHRWMPFDALDHVTLHVGEARHEHFELHPREGEPIALPDEGCEAVQAGVRVLADAGRPARAVDAAGAPTSSACVGATSGRKPAYFSGKLDVVPDRTDDVGPATAVRTKLAEASDGLFRCAEAAPRDRALAPFAAAIVQAKAGPPAKVTPSASSGNTDFDACVASWLATTDLGKSSYKIGHTVRIEILW